MSDVLERSGLVNRLWVGGMAILRDPAPVQMSRQRFESKQRVSNLGLRVYRAFIAAGYPNVLNKITLALQWPDVREPEVLDHLTSLSSVGQPFDVAFFKQEADFFDGDGSTKDFYLQRRVVGPQFYLDNPDMQEMPDYQIRATRFSAQFGTSGATATTITDPSKIIYKDSSTIDTGNPASDEVWIEESGHAEGDRLDTKIRMGTAPASGADTFRVTYIPLMRMYIESDAGRTFQQKLQMARGFTFTEA